MLSRLLPLILGAFAIGTETFMISGVLPTIAADLRISPATAGSLVTIFALAYAVGSPVLAVVTADFERKRVLSVALGVFAFANVLAALAPSFFWLAAARVALALSAGAFMPAAVAFATGMHSPEQRGRAIALVYAGMTLATVVGVPAGTLVASLANWRATFLGVGALSAVAVLGVVAILPRLGGVEAVGFAERLAVARRPDALKLLTLTTLALIGPFAANTYLGVLAEATLGVGGVSLAGVLMIFGVLSLFGSQYGGYAADRWPRERFLAVIFVVLIVGFSALSVGADPRRRGRSDGAILRAGAVGRCSAGHSRSSSRRGSSRSTLSSPRSRCRSTRRRSTSAPPSAHWSAPSRSGIGRSPPSAGRRRSPSSSLWAGSSRPLRQNPDRRLRSSPRSSPASRQRNEPPPIAVVSRADRRGPTPCLRRRSPCGRNAACPK